MRIVLVLDCDWESLGAAAAAFEASGCEAIPFRSGLRGLAYCERPDSACDAVFIHLNNSGAGLWLADRIARARPGVPVAVTSYVFRVVPASMPRTITLWPKPVTRQMVREVAEGRKPPPAPPVPSSIVRLH